MVATKKHPVRLMLVAMACGWLLGVTPLAFSAWLDGMNELQVGDRTYPICPEKELPRLAFLIREVPDDQNAAIEYIKAINLYVKEPQELADLYGYVQGNLWIEEASALLPWLEKNAGAIVAVREAAGKPDCKFPVLKEPKVPFVNVLLPHLSTMRSLGRLLIIEGKHLEHQKKVREALDTYLAILKMGYHVSKEPILISGLVGIALDAMGSNAIESCILRNRLDAATITYLQERLRVTKWATENYEIAMSGERVFGMSLVDDLLDRPGQLSLTDLGASGSKLQNLLPITTKAFPELRETVRAIMKSDFRKYWKAMDEWNKLPDHIAFRPENQPSDKLIEELPAWSLARMLVPALGRARLAFARGKAQKAVLDAVAALELYRQKKGAYPANLNEPEEILRAIPLDPFSNEPLKYNRTEDGYLIYSIGDNLVDDGGVEGEKGQPKDIVVRNPFPKPEPFKADR